MDPDWRKDPKRRAKASRALRQLSSRALVANKSPEELQRENVGTPVTEGGIPVMWGNSAGQRLRGADARIKTRIRLQRGDHRKQLDSFWPGSEYDKGLCGL